MAEIGAPKREEPLKVPAPIRTEPVKEPNITPQKEPVPA